MKKISVCLAVLLVAFLMGGTVWALDGTDHVKVAPNGKGDLLIFPWYFAMSGGYNTKISVINTSKDYSVVAKVVYRSYAWSVEVLDHMIYLSPNDVWTGTLVYENDTAVLKCSDDSMLGQPVSVGLATADDFADKKPVSQNLFNPVTAFGCLDDSNQIGYVEVIEAAAFPITETQIAYAGGKVAKKDIYNYYHSSKVTDDTIVNSYFPINVLTGYQENFIGTGQTLKRAAVFADYRAIKKAAIGSNSKLGVNAANSLAEVEAAMSKFDVSLPYVARANGDNTMHIFNFPTKLSAESSVKCERPSYKAYYASPYWNAVYYMCDTYTRNTYDLMENTPAQSGTIFSPIVPSGQSTMCEEVHFNFLNYTAASAAYTEGWVRYNWGQSSTTKSGYEASGLPISYTGTPVLPSAVYWTDSGFNWAEADAAFTNGTVIERGVLLLNYYQYSDL
jgi:hypothetical protein